MIEKEKEKKKELSVKEELMLELDTIKAELILKAINLTDQKKIDLIQTELNKEDDHFNVVLDKAKSGLSAVNRDCHESSANTFLELNATLARLVFRLQNLEI